MDKVTYNKSGLEPMPMLTPAQVRPGENLDVAYAQRCARAAVAIQDTVAPGVSSGDMPMQWGDRSRTVMARALVGDAKEGAYVSRNALALELHEEDAYWKRAYADAKPVIDRSVAAVVADSGVKDPFVQKAVNASAALKDSAEVGNYRGSGEMVTLFGGLLADEKLMAEQHERRALAAHLVMHARMGNRDGRALMGMEKDLPPEAKPVVAHAISTGQQSIVMGMVREWGGMDKPEMLARGAMMQGYAAGLIGQEEKDQKAQMGAGLAGIVLPGAAPEVGALARRAGSMDAADAQALPAHAQANRAIMAQFPMGIEAQAPVLAAEIVRVQAQAREQDLAKLWAKPAPKAETTR